MGGGEGGGEGVYHVRSVKTQNDGFTPEPCLDCDGVVCRLYTATTGSLRCCLYLCTINSRIPRDPNSILM